MAFQSLKSLFQLAFFCFLTWSHSSSLELGEELKKGSSHAEKSVILTLITTSRSSLWTPGRVLTNEQPLEWKATADGMVDQVVLTADVPTFDLSVSRTSDVTITVSSLNSEASLFELIVNSLNIRSISFENAIDLQKLSCTDNQIRALDLNNLEELTELFCHSNQLNELSVGSNDKLSILACFSNQIEELQLENNGLLSSLSCSNNLLKSLNLNNNAQLSSLECRSNLLQTLTITNGNNTIIKKFDTSVNPDLLCIEVDDEEYSNENWESIDEWTVFSEDCTFSNDPPIANDDEYFSLENSVLEIDEIEGVLANDSDPDGDTLEATLVDTVEFGELDLFPDGSFIYEPQQDFSGIDSFTYKANDGEFDSNLARVVINIDRVNEPPTAVDDSYSTDENQELRVNEANGILANDSDPDNDMLTASLVENVRNGILNLELNGSFSYVPNTGFFGIDSFTYQSFDGLEFSNVAEVIIEVLPVHRIVAPNAFTPNGDQLNDTFRPVYYGMDRVELRIFDTWSTLIYYESGSELKGWDGLVRKRTAENGNYLYRINALTREGENVELEGILTLIR